MVPPVALLPILAAVLGGCAHHEVISHETHQMVYRIPAGKTASQAEADRRLCATAYSFPRCMANLGYTTDWERRK